MKIQAWFPFTSAWLVLWLGIPCAPVVHGAGLADLRFEARAVGPSTIEPLQAVEVELLLSNPTAAPMSGVPRLAPGLRFLTFHLRHRGRDITPGKPIMSVENVEGVRPFRTLQAGVSDRAQCRLAFDWEKEQFLFREPGAYEVWATLHSEDFQQSVASTRVRVVVNNPDASRRAEIDELLASKAYQYVECPAAITFDRDADGRTSALTAFASRHPASPYNHDIPFVAATLHGYRALVTHKRDRVRSEEHLQAQKAALLKYVRQPKGIHRDRAKAALKEQFGLEDEFSR